MVNEDYKSSSCPYHRALYWLSKRWVLATVLLGAVLALGVLAGGYYT